MRKWLKDKQISENLDLENTEHLASFETMMDDVIKKAEFLVKLEKSAVFQSINPSEDIYEGLSYKIPSYARDHKKDEEELKLQEEVKQHPEQELSLWRQHYKNWNTNLKEQGMIRSEQQKL